MGQKKIKGLIYKNIKTKVRIKKRAINTENSLILKNFLIHKKHFEIYKKPHGLFKKITTLKEIINRHYTQTLEVS